jgi:hypothetical protein
MAATQHRLWADSSGTSARWIETTAVPAAGRRSSTSINESTVVAGLNTRRISSCVNRFAPTRSARCRMPSTETRRMSGWRWLRTLSSIRDPRRAKRRQHAQPHARRPGTIPRIIGCRHRVRQRRQVRGVSVRAADHQRHAQPAARQPLAADRRRTRGVLIRSVLRLEAEQLSRQQHRVLQRADVLFASYLPAFGDDSARGGRIGDSLDEKPSKTFARGVETRIVVQPPDNPQQLVDREVHGATTGPSEVAPPGRASAHQTAFRCRPSARL